jgi:uncharacterized membrane protein YraQ (UPF0718 family)
MAQQQWRDSWSAALWAFVLFINLSFALALWGAFDMKVAAIDFILTLIVSVVISKRTPLKIRVEGDWLYIGKAKIESKYISSIEVLGSNQMSRLRTRDANPNAYLDLRFWVSEGIKIDLNDQRDYTPYWLISTSHGAAIKAALKLIS